MRRSKLNLDAKDFATFAAWSDQVNVLSTCTARSLSEVVHFMMLLPRRRAWIGRVNVDHCFTFFWVWYHRISEFSLNIVFLGLLANPFFLRYSILLCRLHTDKFPQSVVIWGDPLWRVRITWVRGPTLAALRACIMHNKIAIYFTLYNTIHSGALSNARRAQRNIMGSKICFAMLSSRSIHEFPISDPYKFWWEIKSSLRTSVLSCLRMFLSFPGFELNKGIYNLYLTVYIGHPGYGQLTAVKIGYLLTSATWPYRGLRCTLSQWWYVF